MYKTLSLQTWIDMFDPSELNLDKLEEYISFIKEAIDRYDSTRYSESHHILPRCIDKDSTYDSERALINGRDHFLAHLKLVECFNGVKKRSLAYAVVAMKYQISSQGEIINPEDYEKARKIYSESVKGENNPNYGKGLSGDKNGMYGVHRYGKDHPMYGKHHSEETKKRLSEINKGHGLFGEKNGMYGKKHTEESRKKMSDSRKGEKNHMYGRVGELSPNYGKHHSEETRQKISESNKGKTPTKGRVWINNGNQNLYIKQDDPIPEGYTYGMLSRTKI